MSSSTVPAPFGVASVASSTDVILVSRRAAHRLIAATIIGILLLPSVVWILSDRHLWWWDQSAYGSVTLDLWNTLGIGPWLAAMVNALRAMPPMLSTIQMSPR